MTGTKLGLALSLAFVCALPLRGSELVVDDFEGSQARGYWALNHDNSHLGTVMLPEPFVTAPDGAPGSPKGCACIHGHLGLNQAPWSWAQLQVGFKADRSPVDLSKYHSISFWARGDGAVHKVRLLKASITDSDHFGATFAAPGAWTLVRLPLDSFKQAGWGKAVDQDFKDVTAVEFSPGTNDTDFNLCVDSVVLSTDTVQLKPRPYDTRGWWRYPGVDVLARQGTALDLSGRLDAPAGKHGQTRAAGEAFAFADGTPVSFFGVNLVASANFPTHAQADAMALLLAEMGVNIVRHHHLEAPWSDRSLFPKGGGTRQLDPESLDRLDYLDAQLEKRGIYLYLDMLVSRPGLAEDGVKDPGDLVNGWKVKAEFAPDLLGLQKEFIRQFLTHENPYTHRRLATDPAVAGMEIINEDSLFYRGDSGDFAVKGAVYAKDLQDRFNAWLRSKVKGRRALAARWQRPDGSPGLAADEDPKAGTVRPVASWQGDASKALSPARIADERRFNYDLQLGYYRQMEAHLRSLGYQGLVTGSNHWTGDPADLLANASMGFIDRHAYFAHPQGGWGYSTAIRWEPSAMLHQPGLGIVSELAMRRVKGLPFISTEWQCAAPNDFRVDAELDMAAACSFQGWSAVQFAFRHSSLEDLSTFAGVLDNNFDVANQPAQLALWPAASVLALRGDVPKATESAWQGLSPAQALAPDASLRAPGRKVLMGECGVDLDGPGTDLVPPTEGWTRSPDGALQHDPAKGLLLIDSPGTQAIAGFSHGQQEHPSRLKAQLDNPYAVLVATALDSADLATAKHVLMTAVSNAVNEGMALSASGDQLAVAGGPAVLVEPVTGSVWLGINPQGAKVWALDPSGRRRHAVKAWPRDHGLAWELRAEDQAMHYEIQAPGKP